MVEVKAINKIQLLSRCYCQQQAIIITFAKVVFSAGQWDYPSEQQELGLFKVLELLKEQTNPIRAEVINRGLPAEVAFRSAMDGGGNRVCKVEVCRKNGTLCSMCYIKRQRGLGQVVVMLPLVREVMSLMNLK